MRKYLLSLAATLAFASLTSAQHYKVTIDPGPTDRQATVISTTISDLRPSVPRFLGTLTAADGKETLRVQADVLQDPSGNVTGTRIQWLQPPLAANQPRTYTFTYSIVAYDTLPFFHFVEAAGHRDLFFNKQPVYRYINQYSPADHANTSKPFHHVYGFHGEGPITKGPGGSFPHHRGLFFGYKTEHGDFWHCRDCRQEHTGFRFETESTGPVSARSVSAVDWIDKTNTAVIRDTRDVAAYRLSDSALILDFDIAVETLTGKPIELTGDPQHAGFHFRAAQEVADAKPAGADATAGGAAYIRPPGAKFTRNDEWIDCPWVACNFTVQGNPYTVIHMDHPTNPKPTTYSTRAYGRFGPFFITTVEPNQPLKLRYRVAVLDARAHADLSPEKLAAWYADFTTPSTVTVSK